MKNPFVKKTKVLKKPLIMFTYSELTIWNHISANCHNGQLV